MERAIAVVRHGDGHTGGRSSRWHGPESQQRWTHRSHRRAKKKRPASRSYEGVVDAFAVQVGDHDGTAGRRIVREQKRGLERAVSITKKDPQISRTVCVSCYRDIQLAVAVEVARANLLRK